MQGKLLKHLMDERVIEEKKVILPLMLDFRDI